MWVLLIPKQIYGPQHPYYFLALEVVTKFFLLPTISFNKHEVKLLFTSN